MMGEIPMTAEEQKLEERLDKIEGMVTVLWRTVGMLTDKEQKRLFQLEERLNRIEKMMMSGESNGL